MTEKPILFSSEMVRAILEGRKTQTRRVMKPQPVFSSGYWWYDEISFRGEDDLQDYLFHNVYGSKGSPYGSVYGDGTSDTLWVRETWQAQNLNGQWWHEVPRSERSLHNWGIIDKATLDPDLPIPPKWIPSIFMPRWASRIILRINDIRIEQLKDASINDLMAEGCPIEYLPDSCNGMSHAVHGWFENLWDSINLKRGYSWQSNPWVWVVKFEKVER